MHFLLDLEQFSREVGFNSYDDLAKVLYYSPNAMQYRQFSIPKRNGKMREISTPKRWLKELQEKVLKLLISLYRPPQSAHAFIANRSIVTNAQMHLKKNVVLTIDLKDFFPTIHFGRVKNLLSSHPYSIPDNIATVIAHICCHKGVLPQGAPTSPLLSNMICWKLDRQLLAFASKNRFTYSRYADDITFSSTMKASKIPRQLAIVHSDNIIVGDKLQNIISENGFEINTDKVRLKTQSERMEVTGLTVNHHLNVSKKYYKQIRSMLYARATFGHDAAEKEHHEKYYKKYRPSKELPPFEQILHGKLLFFKMIKGANDKKYIQYAKLFNKYYPKEDLQLKYDDYALSSIDELTESALFILEHCFDNKQGNECSGQGTGFYVQGIGLVTCAHVLPPIEYSTEIECYRSHDVTTFFEVKEVFRDDLHDLAICNLLKDGKEYFPPRPLRFADEDPKGRPKVSICGFPNYKKGATPSVEDGKLTSTFMRSALRHFEVDIAVRSGYSGAPLLDSDLYVIGIATEGAEKGGGQNGALSISGIKALLSHPS